MELSAMKQALDALEQTQYAYSQAIGCLHHDGSTAAPRGSAAARGVTLGFLSKKSHELMVRPQTRELIESLWACRDELEAPVRRRVELLKKRVEELTRIPVEEHVAYSRLVNESSVMWRQAKENNDYSRFEPYLAQVLDYCRRFASYKDASKPAYDVMLDDYEKGMNTQTLDAFFAMLRERLVPLIGPLSDQPPAPDFVRAYCPVEAQQRLSERLMDILGLDRQRCAIAQTEHPYTVGFNRWDVRITTHYYENAFLSSMYSVIHEGGHALYELGMDEALQFTCLNDCPSLGLHESQSRFYENLVGHTPGFLSFLAPTLRELFPEALGGIDDGALIRAANRMAPSLVRTEADEVTYPLHIMVRYELEKRLVSGDLSTRDLPEAWNALYRDNLGICPANDSQGVLQDMHWSEGMFGYFPTYALGSAYASQLRHAMSRELDVDALAAHGNLAPITAWLRERIHRHGNLYDPRDLLKRATGEDFHPEYYVAHLTRRATER